MSEAGVIGIRAEEKRQSRFLRGGDKAHGQGLVAADDCGRRRE